MIGPQRRPRPSCRRVVIGRCNLKMTGLTIKNIAEQYDISPGYANLLTLRKGFPEPMEVIGRNKIFLPSEVAEYFANHRRGKPTTK